MCHDTLMESFHAFRREISPGVFGGGSVFYALADSGARVVMGKNL